MTPGDQNLGVRCGADGLFLAGAPLLEKRGGGYHVRPAADLDRLLYCAYRGRPGASEILPGLQRAAAALNRHAVSIAMGEAACMPLPELPNPIVALRLEIEDLMIAAEPLRKALLRAGWDPDQHPRAGMPPNPGWFAPTSGSSLFQPAAASEEEERPEGVFDPLAEVRERIWDSGQATLRTIDPTHLSLQSLHGPDWVPSQADLDTLDNAIRNVEIRRITDKIRPNGKPIGAPGSSSYVRLLSGGLPAAQSMFSYLRLGGSIYENLPSGIVVRLPANVGFVTFRLESLSKSPAIDINLSAILYMRIHYP